MTASAARIVHREPTGQVTLVEVERRFFDVMTKHFGPRFLDYRRAWTRSSAFDHLPDFPLSLDLEVNASCNLSCVMCVMADRDRSRESGGFMDSGLYRNLMAEAARAGLPAMTYGFLSEPLLRPDLAEMIRVARESGVMDIRLGTNGLLLTRDLSRRLIEAGLTRLEVSVDAAEPETYRRIRQGGRLDVVERNIEAFLETRDQMGSDFPLLRLSFLKLPLNDGELGAFMDHWAGRADLFSIQEPIYFEKAPISGQYAFEAPGPAAGYRCAQPWQRLIVRADGQVFPCCSIYGLDLPLGSALKKPIADLWSSPRLERLREAHKEGRLSDLPVCRRCAVRSNLKPILPNGPADGGPQ
jgi:radical SAM protein with 4Fe4S-binding SPASM domain